ASIGLAIDGGAKIIVCPGFNFEVAIYEAQTRYHKVNFILLDGEPHTADYKTYKTESNVKCVKYAEQQAGFLAGYSVVKDGMTKLGYMGGVSVPAVIRYGYGFIQGADYAAKEMNLAAGAIEINYNYTGKFEATPEAQTMAAGWYANGTQAIFGCGGALGDSVMAAAATAGAIAIGVDVDQSSESPTVITSAMKNLTKSVYDSLKEYYAGNFAGGATLIVDVKSQGVGLPMATSKFTTFSQADYDAIYAKLVADEITILTDTDQDSAAKLATTNVVVNVIE
ncbi:MAG TPA: BMP family ABC transporter substrate-binding protein, partial [Bacillota bacterium]|nr:BMP family ABC transporter substrate-binding protein [Bacillota bacterium]